MTTRPKQLTLLINGQRAGTVSEGEAGRLALDYDDSWRESPESTPLSLSMPLSSRSHDDQVVRAFLWGLLPDNEQVLDRWARAYQVSARNPFALLAFVGEDCAGGCQLVTPTRADEVAKGVGTIDWIDNAEVARRLRTLRRDPTAWHSASSGQFSLAGAQAKTALHYDDATHRWGDPRGAIPTTHILKPAISGFADHDLNEHLCLETARELGLAASRSRIELFEDERAIVVERYDRQRRGDRVLRVHQEDVCQALGLMPTMKYENEGGPSPEQIVELIRNDVRPARLAKETVDQFIDALAFNWIIGGTDAHAKNYSFLLMGRQARLAPLYDMASALVCDMHVPKLVMAMRIGGEYKLATITGRHWRRLADAVGVDADSVIERISHLARHTPTCIKAAGAAVPDPLTGPLVETLIGQVTARARRCEQVLAT